VEIYLKITPAELVRVMEDNHDNMEAVLEKIHEGKTMNTSEEKSLLGGSTSFGRYGGGYGRRRLRRGYGGNRSRSRRRTMATRKKQEYKRMERSLINAKKTIEKYTEKLPEVKKKWEEAEAKEKEKKEKEKERIKKAKAAERKKKAMSKNKNMILNPDTGRYVKRNGPTGQRIAKELAKKLKETAKTGVKCKKKEQEQEPEPESESEEESEEEIEDSEESEDEED
jgi:hypothetical protein